jgi:hypothetical protein
MSKSDYVGVLDNLATDYFEASLPPRSKYGIAKSLDIEAESPLTLHSSTLNHSILQAFGSCQLKGSMLVGGNPSLQPTTFAQDHMQSGTRFETDAMDHFHLWHHKLGECGLSCPCLPYEHLDGNTYREQEKYFESCLGTIEQGKPRIFVQVPLHLPDGERIAGIKEIHLEGVIDVLIWTGEVWVIGDTKCAETAQTSYGNQVTLYSKIWQSKFPEQALHPKGFIAHCSPGNLYSVHASPTSRLRALRNIVITPIQYDLYEKSLQQAFANYLSPCTKPTFKAHCIECQFRYHCYRQMILQAECTDISFFPNLSPSDIVILRENGVDTVEALLARFESGQGYELVNSSPDMLPYLRGRAEAVIRFKGFSSLTLPEDMLEQGVFVAYNPAEKTNMVGALSRQSRRSVRLPLAHVHEDWFVEHLGIKEPRYVISYTPQEANCAYHIENGILPSLKGQRVSVLELLRDDVHLPFPSYGLPEVAHLLDRTIQQGTREGIRAWFERICMEDPEETKYQIEGLPKADNLAYLEMTVHNLLLFGEQCRLEELKYV